MLIDRCIGLQQTIHDPILGLHIAIGRTKHTGCHGALKPQGVADGYNRTTHPCIDEEATSIAGITII